MEGGWWVQRQDWYRLGGAETSAIPNDSYGGGVTKRDISITLRAAVAEGIEWSSSNLKVASLPKICMPKCP